MEERIIERAERKLRLDAMVIQSGRLVDAAKKLSKDEILKMVRYGAERIIHSDVENITDEDIDTILAKSQAKVGLVCRGSSIQCSGMYEGCAKMHIVS